ncbi:ribbon-helix-helix domain-containing protein [Faecalicatena acetigenes]|uniref:Ribbon-helix-helix domain-containing protein n=1 Tax=Faecalicatena acetigenes TaxID=2981790 RepID=A0ABT2TED9_9FIRM|nr:ribbon-helix-helix domain-containing protein [Faecalicatena acetigenes]MCU6748029.1 ribbon-helix-helix domain-containing protein [Faecalicatena acetigenes]SCI22453.1 Ribbon-helix-helix protein%2C copG family [uncultured Clostridium sp.]
MAAMKKGTKLTDNPKDYMLRVRMDKETVEKLDKVCKVQNISRSEVVRNGIEEQYRKTKK